MSENNLQYSGLEAKKPRPFSCTCGAWESNQRFVERVKALWKEEQATNEALKKHLAQILATWRPPSDKP